MPARSGRTRSRSRSPSGSRSATCRSSLSYKTSFAPRAASPCRSTIRAGRRRFSRSISIGRSRTPCRNISWSNQPPGRTAPRRKVRPACEVPLGLRRRIALGRTRTPRGRRRMLLGRLLGPAIRPRAVGAGRGEGLGLGGRRLREARQPFQVPLRDLRRPWLHRQQLRPPRRDRQRVPQDEPEPPRTVSAPRARGCRSASLLLRTTLSRNPPGMIPRMICPCPGRIDAPFPSRKWHLTGLVSLLLAPLPTRKGRGRRAPTSCSSSPTTSAGTPWASSSASRADGGRFPWFKTPNMDRLAAEGVRFRNAFVVNSLCSPSRASFLTGRYGHVNGVANNHTPFPADSVTHAAAAPRRGLRAPATSASGTWAQQRPAARLRLLGQLHRPGPLRRLPVRGERRARPRRRAGSTTSLDRLRRPVPARSKDEAVPAGRRLQVAHGPFDAARPGRRTPTPARRATACAEPGRPGRLMPGGRPKAPARKRPGACPTNLRLLPLHHRRRREPRPDPRRARRPRLAENTVVVFASDNGYYLGEHAWATSARPTTRACASRCWSATRSSDCAGRTVDAMVLNIDLAPTLPRLRGRAGPRRMQGRSWRPLLEGPRRRLAEGVLL